MVIRKMPQRLLDQRLLWTQPSRNSAKGKPLKRALHHESHASVGASLLDFRQKLFDPGRRQKPDLSKGLKKSSSIKVHALAAVDKLRWCRRRRTSIADALGPLRRRSERCTLAFRAPVLGVRGKPFTGSGFRCEFFKLIGRLEKTGKVGIGLTFHGLRHTVGKRLADAGCDTRDIQAWLGHKTAAMAEHYAKEADQKRRVRGAVVKLDRARRRKPE
jgi:hypothetical protein